MYSTSPLQSTEYTVLVVARSPVIARALRMACPRCVLHHHYSAQTAVQAFSQHPALILCALDVPDFKTLYQQAPVHLRPRFIFLSDGLCAPRDRAFLDGLDDPPLLYMPLSTTILQTILDTARAHRASTGTGI